MSFLWALFEFATCFLESVLTFTLFNQKLGCSEKRRLLLIAMIPVIAGITFTLNLLELSDELTVIIMALITFSYSLFLFDNTVTSRCVWGVVPSVIYMIGNELTALTVKVLKLDALMTTIPETTARAMAMLIYDTVIVLVFFGILLVQKKKYSMPVYLRIALSIIVLMGVVSTTINQSLMVHSSAANSVLYAIANILVLIMSIVSVSIFFSMANLHNEKLEAQKEIQKAQLEAEQLEKISSMYDYVSGFRHDMKASLTTLMALAENNDTDGIIKTINTLDESVRTTTLIVSSGNPAIDATISGRLIVANNVGIDIQRILAIPPNIKLNMVDACSIITNLMNNAIEAVQKLPKEMQSASIELSMRAGMLCIEVINSTDGVYNYKPSGEFATTKKDKENHGFGLARVKQLAERNNGTCLVEVQENTFKVTVLVATEGNV